MRRGGGNRVSWQEMGVKEEGVGREGEGRGMGKGREMRGEGGGVLIIFCLRAPGMKLRH